MGTFHLFLEHIEHKWIVGDAGILKKKNIFFISLVGKRVYGLADGKWLPSLMDVKNATVTLVEYANSTPIPNSRWQHVYYLWW